VHTSSSGYEGTLGRCALASRVLCGRAWHIFARLVASVGDADQQRFARSVLRYWWQLKLWQASFLSMRSFQGGKPHESSKAQIGELSHGCTRTDYTSARNSRKLDKNYESAHHTITSAISACSFIEGIPECTEARHCHQRTYPPSRGCSCQGDKTGGRAVVRRSLRTTPRGHHR
jgi:hypothetical protein